MIIGLNNQRRSCKLEYETLNFQALNEESEKRFIEENEYLFHDLAIMKKTPADSFY